MDYMSEWHDPFKRLTFEQWMASHTKFNFIVKIEGLPNNFLEAQNQRLRDTQFKLSCLGCGDKIPVPGAGLPAH